MKNLRFLKFHDGTFYRFEAYSGNLRFNLRFANDPSYLSDKLRSLYWDGYPFKALPSNFVPKNLVELDLRNSNLEELCENTMRAPKLKWIIFRTCPYLIKVSDHLDAPLLEKIDIQNCQNLLVFPSPDLQFNKLQFNKLRHLNLRYCEKIESFPNNISFPSLLTLDLSFCFNLHTISDLLELNKLHWLNLSYCRNLRSFPNISFPSLVNLHLSYCIKLLGISDLLDGRLLRIIDLTGCKNLLVFPSPVHQFNKLHKLNLRYCENLQSFPSDIQFPSLISLDLHGCTKLNKISNVLDAPRPESVDVGNCKNLLGFPSPVQQFNELRQLNLRYCENLESFPGDIKFPSLISLDLHGCTKLNKISNVLDAPLLSYVNVENCKNLLGFPSPVNDFNNLYVLNLKNCKNLRSFPSNKIHFPSLRRVNFDGCIKFKEFPHISGKIKELLMRKTAIQEVPLSIQNLTELVILDLKGCTELKHISTNICKLKALKELRLSSCSTLERFPEILETMGSLKTLDLSGTAIKGLHNSIENLCGLNVLRLKGCKNIHELPPSIVSLTELVELDLKGCKGLKNISTSICKLKAFEELCLRSCSTLECFRSLKILDLSGTTIRGLHHSIENLSGLEVLRLEGCENIHEVPPSIVNLTELVELDLKGCTGLKNISTSICKFKALRKLDLSFCSALEFFPKILETMESLKYLDLSGTAIKGLHHSIENLSGLEELWLVECENLEMLPISIFNLSSQPSLDLSGCSKLENLRGNSTTDLSNYGESATTKLPICSLRLRAYFTDCLKLDKTAIVNMMELLINQHRYLTTKGCATQAVNLKFVYSGSEAPRWFEPLTAGSSTNFQISGHNDVKGHLIGLALCAVIEFYDEGHDDGGHDNEGHDDESNDEESDDDEGDGYYGATIDYNYCWDCMPGDLLHTSISLRVLP